MSDETDLIEQARECAETLDPTKPNGRDVLWAVALLGQLADALEKARRDAIAECLAVCDSYDVSESKQATEHEAALTASRTQVRRRIRERIAALEGGGDG